MGDVSAATTTHSVVFFFYLRYTVEELYSVYQHVTPDGMYYFGATQNVERRWRNNGAGYKRTALQPYIEKYGWDNIQHIVLFKDQSKENALWIEDFLITTAQEDGVCINKNRSGLVSKEEGYKQQRYQQNRQKELERSRQRYQQNRDEILEYQREYQRKNREKYSEYQREYQREYREKNKEQIRKQKQQYYKQNKDKMLEKKREYRQRKKLEKQLKEVQTTLF